MALLQAVFALAVLVVADVPHYGGEKLFMPFFPFWCVLAAQGAVVVAQAVVALLDVQRIGARAAVMVVVLGLGAAPGVRGTLHLFGGAALSYYGEFIGGLRGAVARGYERTYYDVADKGLARWLDDQAGVHASARDHPRCASAGQVAARVEVVTGRVEHELGRDPSARLRKRAAELAQRVPAPTGGQGGAGRSIGPGEMIDFGLEGRLQARRQRGRQAQTQLRAALVGRDDQVRSAASLQHLPMLDSGIAQLCNSI